LPLVDPAARSVAGERDDPESILTLFRRLIRLRATLEGPLEGIEASDGVLSFRRGAHLVAVNATSDHRPLGAAGELVLESDPGVVAPGPDGAELAPHGAAVIRIA
jgi:hypothetical protein